MGRRWLILAAVVVCGVASRAGAYSPDWMATRFDMAMLSREIESYRRTQGRFPASTNEKTWFDQLAELDEYGFLQHYQPRDGLPTDRFGHTYIYEPPADLFAEPGTPQAAYRLASVGDNGIDDHGEKDDLTLGRTMNDGYHGYKNRPLMRRLAVFFGVGFVALIVLAAWLASRRIVLLLAASAWAALGFIVCVPLHYTGFGLGGTVCNTWNSVYDVAVYWFWISVITMFVFIVVMKILQRLQLAPAPRTSEGADR
jgi:hypothetical protein